MKAKTKEFLIPDDMSVKDAMRTIGKVGERILFVVNETNELLGSLTDGDIRRWVLKEGNLNSTVREVYNKNPFSIDIGFDIEEIKKIMIRDKIEGIPVVDKKRVVNDVLVWSAVFGKNGSLPQARAIDVPIVIMAGGKGTRLDPFTKVLPKPLIPIGDKTIIEIILEKFLPFGVKEFYVAINFKSHMIKAFFEESGIEYKIHYIEESKPLGTAGALKFLEGKIKDALLVSNCDIIIESDYSEIVDFHKSRQNDITIVSSFRHFTVPYGICRIEDGGNLVDIEEKPEYDFLVNTGMYVINKEVLRLIPKNKYYNFTDLIQSAKSNGMKVGVFPIDEKSWIDIGQWDEYHKATQNFGARY